MERTQEIFDKIEAYLGKSLSKEEQKAFEDEMAKNVALQLEVEKHKSLHNVLIDKDTLAFKEKLTVISKKIKEENTPISFFTTTWKIAATIVVILGIGSLFWYSSSSQNQTKDLYAKYYEPFPAEDITRGENTYDLGVIKNYSAKAYNKVIIELENKSDLKDNYRVYLGNSYMNTGQEQKAIIQFSKIEKNSSYYENSRWYLSLTYLKLGQPKKTMVLLEEIINYNGIYKNDAIRLNKALQE